MIKLITFILSKKVKLLFILMNFDIIKLKYNKFSKKNNKIIHSFYTTFLK